MHATALCGTCQCAHQGVSHALAAARIDIEAAQLMTMRAAWLHDQGQPAGEAANMAKYLAAEAALAALDAGNGVASEYGLIPLWGLARVLRLVPVSREMILNFVAQHSLGCRGPTEAAGVRAQQVLRQMQPQLMRSRPVVRPRRPSRGLSRRAGPRSVAHRTAPRSTER